MLKLPYIKAKISIIHSQHSLPFSSIKMLCTKNLNLTIHFEYNLRFKKWFLGAGKVKKIKIKIAPQLDKFD